MLLLLLSCVAHHPAAVEACAERLPVARAPYAVIGATLEEALAAVRAQGPADASGRRWPGATSCDVKYTCTQTDDGVEVAFDTAITVRLPEWHAAGDEAARWAEGIARLSRHEDGHVEIGQATLACLPRVAARAATCDEVKRLVHAALDRMAEENAAYDRTTGHGTFL